MDLQPPSAPQPTDAPPPPATTPVTPPPVAPPPVAPVPSSAPPYWQGGAAPPTGPAPGVEFAGYGARILAYLVDGILITIGVWVVAFLALLTGSGSELNILATILIGFAVLLALAYFPFFWQRTGQTPGMQALNIRVVRDKDGGPLGWGSAILRLIGYTINSIIFGLPIGWLWILFDSRRRGWHDLIGGTVVVKA
jgi:uncharacterized RDD family membrane protein YckC